MSVGRFLTAFAILIVAFTSRAESPLEEKRSEVTVSSAYSTPRGELLINGRGVYVVIADIKRYNVAVQRHFILTAAHLTQGNRLTIKLNGEPLHVLGRLSSSRKDLEIIEVAPPTQGAYLAVWDKKARAFINVFTGLRRHLRAHFGSAGLNAFFVGNDMGDAASERLFGPIGQAPFIPIAEGESFSRAIEFTHKTSPVRHTIFRTAIDQIIFASKFAPGMSGSPVFVHYANLQSGLPVMSVGGIVTQYARFEKRSFAIGGETIRSLFERFLKKERGELIENLRDRDVVTSWLHNGDLTFRILRDASTGEIIAQEASSANREAGEGTNGDGGEGTNGDGGEGTNGDGGGGGNQTSLRYAEGTFISGVQARALVITDSVTGRVTRLSANWAGVNFALELSKRFRVQPDPSISNAEIDISRIEHPINSKPEEILAAEK
jgi:uncharacterized membrane protein YgcG